MGPYTHKNQTSGFMSAFSQFVLCVSKRAPLTSTNSLNELKEICSLPFNETNSTLCDFKCSDPSSMARHVYKVHASPFYDLSRDRLILPPWLSHAMEKRAGTKDGLVQPASPRTPSLSSSPRSSTKSNLCTPSPLPEESPAGQVKVS